MAVLYEYQNGNCRVILHEDGSKERSWSEKESPRPEFPESIDMKITDYCDMQCKFCHESSTKKGAHASTDTIFRAIEGLQPGVEIAIGGGNPLDHPFLESILTNLTNKGLVPNLTIHGSHAFMHTDRIRNLHRAGIVHGVGISNPGAYSMMSINDMITDYNVCHAIVGVDNPFEVIKIRSYGSNVLVLGYKTFGRGAKFFSDEVAVNISRWKYFIGDILRQPKGVLSFDNLALTQLGIKKLVSEEIWSKHYMGDDGSFTMYFDAVLNQYAASSTKPRRNAEDMNVQEMFQSLS